MALNFSVPWRALLLVLLAGVRHVVLSAKPLEGTESGLDKVVHLMAFSALALAGARGTRAALLVGLLVYDALIEVLPLFVPGRSSARSDLLRA